MGSALVDDKIKDQMAAALGVSHISDKVASVLLLVEQGNSLDVAYQLINNKPIGHKNTKTQLKGKCEKWLLSSPEMQKLQHNAAKKILKGQPIIGKTVHKGEEYINVINPKGSDITSVIDMVTKRTEPIKSQASSGPTFNFTQINASEFRPQDVVSDDSDKVPAIEVSNNNKELEG